jgi:integrase
MRNRMKVLFRLRLNKRDKLAPAYLYCRITLNGIRADPDFSTNVKVTPAHWDSKAQKILSKSAKEDNDTLKNIENGIKEIFNRLVHLKKPVSARIVKDIYLGKSADNFTFLQVFQRFIDAKQPLIGKGLAFRTVQTYQTRYNSVRDFLESTRKTLLLPGEFTLFFADQFVDYLKTKKDCSHDYSMKNVQAVKQVLGHSVKMGILDQNPLAYFEFKFTRHKPLIFLTPLHLEKLESHQFAQTRLQQVADVFLFACYTGLAYADLKRFDYEEHVQYWKQSKRHWITMQRQKSQEPFTVPILRKAMAILDKYHQRLPVISNAKYNSYLKEVADIADIPIKLTTRVARKTCGMILLNSGVPIESVSTILGHSTIRTTQKLYARVLVDKISKDIDQFETID